MKDYLMGVDLAATRVQHSDANRLRDPIPHIFHDPIALRDDSVPSTLIQASLSDREINFLARVSDRLISRSRTAIEGDQEIVNAYDLWRVRHSLGWEGYGRWKALLDIPRGRIPEELLERSYEEMMGAAEWDSQMKDMVWFIENKVATTRTLSLVQAQVKLECVRSAVLKEVEECRIVRPDLERFEAGTSLI